MRAVQLFQILTWINTVRFISSTSVFASNSNLTTTTTALSSSTCETPLKYTPIPNAFTLAQYSNARSACIAECNASGHCCTKGLGGCERVPCASGCHIAFFSDTLYKCKQQCDLANKPGCEYTWNHELIGYAGFNPYWEYGVGVPKCVGSEDCGCPDDDWGNDCEEDACAKGCEIAHSQSLRDLFYNGEDVINDPKGELDETALLNSISKLASHVSGSSSLTVNQMENALSDFMTNGPRLDTNFDALDGALDLVDSYETNNGALFLNAKTKNGFSRTGNNDDLELERTMLAVQQTILDNVYRGTILTARPHDPIIGNCKDYLDGRKWQTSHYYPGYVAPPDDPTIQHTVKITASMASYWGMKVCFADEPRIMSTGFYLSPGSIASIEVPSKLVNKGFLIQVGASTVNNDNKNEHYRMDRITSTYEIRNIVTSIANPLGGGIYIKVPYEANEGVVTITISGGVWQAPIMSMTSIRSTDKAEWENKMQSSPAPWADFETDLFLMQVPTSWIKTYDYDHLRSVLESQDDAMAAVSEFTGFPIDKKNNYVLYVQADLHIEHDAFGVGYPQVNDLLEAGPNGVEPENDHYFVSKPHLQDSVLYHELGHCSVQTYYRGEIEALVNLLYAYIRNVKVGLDFDEAFKGSFDENSNFTPDRAAMHWMVTQNFRNGNEMDYSNTEYDEFRYQERGYAKYADIARLFGWEVLQDFFYQEQLAHEAGSKEDFRIVEMNDNALPFYKDFVNIDYRTMNLQDDIHEEHAHYEFNRYNLADSDDRTLRLSISAGVDLTPLIHFWGIHPVNENKLKNKMKENKLEVSEKVYDLLMKYISLIPKNNAEFVEFFHDVFPGEDGVECASPLYGCGWFNEWRDKYKKVHGNKAVATANEIVEKYYSSTTSTCRSIGSYKYLQTKYCKGRANKQKKKFARHWEMLPGSKDDVLATVCKTDQCKERDCCKLGPQRKCTNTGIEGLIDGGFTQKMCGKNWTLKKSAALSKAACKGQDGFKCTKANCCKRK